MANQQVKRLNATLPEPLARFVAEITGEGGLYETPSEFVRDLIRRYMEKTTRNEQSEINALLTQAIEENEYSDLTADDMVSFRSLCA